MTLEQSIEIIQNIMVYAALGLLGSLVLILFAVGRVWQKVTQERLKMQETLEDVSNQTTKNRSVGHEAFNKAKDVEHFLHSMQNDQRIQVQCCTRNTELLQSIVSQSKVQEVFTNTIKEILIELRTQQSETTRALTSIASTNKNINSLLSLLLERTSAHG